MTDGGRGGCNWNQTKFGLKTRVLQSLHQSKSTMLAVSKGKQDGS